MLDIYRVSKNYNRKVENKISFLLENKISFLNENNLSFLNELSDEKIHFFSDK
jgi:hypothetical protein